MTSEEDIEQDNQRERILVIDDSPVIREMLVEVLTDEGYVVDTAFDGQAGVACALQIDYAAIICDVHMPKMNGMETVRDIIEAKPNSKIILTDSFPDKLSRQAREEGALCCLQKPFDLDELRKLIRQVIVGEAYRVD